MSLDPPEPLFTIERDAPGVDAAQCPQCRRVFPLGHFRRLCSIEETIARGGMGLHRMRVDTDTCRACRRRAAPRVRDIPASRLQDMLKVGGPRGRFSVDAILGELARRKQAQVDGGLQTAARNSKEQWAPFFKALWAVRSNILARRKNYEKHRALSAVSAYWDAWFETNLYALSMAQRRMRRAQVLGLPLPASPNGDPKRVWYGFVTPSERTLAGEAHRMLAVVLLTQAQRRNSYGLNTPLSGSSDVGAYLAAHPDLESHNYKAPSVPLLPRPPRMPAGEGRMPPALRAAPTFTPSHTPAAPHTRDDAMDALLDRLEKGENHDHTADH